MENIPPPLNFRAKTIWTGDNLHIMRGMNSATIDLIYLDPPFNSKANYAAPIGSAAAGAAFKDTWTLDDLDLEWIREIQSYEPALRRVVNAAMTDSDKSYLVYMAIRLLEMRRLLKPTGSIYLHCDPTMSHYLKLVMDAVFGRKNFRNEIIWHYAKGHGPIKAFRRKHDVILRYTDKKCTFNIQRYAHLDNQHYRFNKIDGSGRKYRINHVRDSEGEYKRFYLDDGVPVDSVWSFLRENKFDQLPHNAKERTGYPTQKPLILLNRIIKASSNEGDLVFDPFCGCATTCVAAHNYGRDWVGIDVSEKAAELVVNRISEVQGSMYKDIIHRKDIPQRTDLGPIPKYNSIANKRSLYGNQEGKCKWCTELFDMRHLEVDHIVARSKGGSDHISNLQLLCSSCNRMGLPLFKWV